MSAPPAGFMLMVGFALGACTMLVFVLGAVWLAQVDEAAAEEAREAEENPMGYAPEKGRAA